MEAVYKQMFIESCTKEKKKNLRLEYLLQFEYTVRQIKPQPFLRLY